MKTIKRLNQAGDTIIEVLVVLAVLSMSFGISYATASHSLNGSLNAEEHSEALGILDTQLEDLRIALTTHPNGFPPPNPNGTAYFCMTGTDTFTNLSGTVPSSSLTDSRVNHFSEYGASCTFSKYYYVSINEVDTATGTSYGSSYTTPIATNCGASQNQPCNEDSFTIMVRWDGVGNLGPQQESITYRFSTNNLNAGAYSPPEVYVPPVPILVILNKIPLTGPSGTTTDPTPSCSAAATSGVTGATVTLNGPGYFSTQSTSGGDAQFQNLTNNDTYTATVTGLPAGYQLCQNGSAALVPANLGSATPTSSSPNPLVINASARGISARPVCTPQLYTPPAYWQWVPTQTWGVVGYNPVYTYYWSYIGTWYTTSNTTYIGVYAKVANTQPSAATYNWIGWEDPYKIAYKDWAWPMFQVDDYLSGFSPIYGWIYGGYFQLVQPPSYNTYNCPP